MPWPRETSFPEDASLPANLPGEDQAGVVPQSCRAPGSTVTIGVFQLAGEAESRISILVNGFGRQILARSAGGRDFHCASRHF